MEDKISIIIPIYNAEKTLERCIKSILVQSYNNIEIILVNDGSRDNSLLICKKYSLIDGRIRIIDRKNCGVSSARNIGIEYATGKFVMFCDSDDWVAPDWCEILINNYQEDSLTMCGTYIEGNQKYYDALIISKKGKEIVDRVDFYSLKDKFFYPPWNKIYLNSILKKNKIKFDENISNGEDLLFNVQYLSSISGKIIFLDLAAYHYVWPNASSLSNRITKDYCLQCKMLFEKLNKYIKLIGILSTKNRNRLCTDCFNEFYKGIKYLFEDHSIGLIKKWKLVNLIMKDNSYHICALEASISNNRIYNWACKQKVCYAIWIMYKLREGKR